MAKDKEKKKMKTWKKVLLIVLLSLVLLVILAIAGVFAYSNYLLNQITPYDPANDITVSQEEADRITFEDDEFISIDEPDASNPENGTDGTTDENGTEGTTDENGEVIPNDPETNDANQGTADTEIPNLEDLEIEEAPVVEVDNGDHVINIMLIGQDRRPGQGRQRSDSMILLTINKSKGTITLTSFMRDQYVKIPGYKNNKMNAAYAFGGMKLLNSTVEKNFGVKVDGDIEVDFNNFKKLIDMLGGVDIKLTSKEAKHLNSTNNWNLSSGKQRLNGEQALAYSRIRKIDSDYNRANRQRNVISSLINRYKSLSLKEMIFMLDDILPLVTTNMSKNEIVDVITDVAPMLSGAQINSMRIPVDGTFKQGNVRVRAGLAAWFQYNIDFTANRKVLKEIMAK